LASWRQPAKISLYFGRNYTSSHIKLLLLILVRPTHATQHKTHYIFAEKVDITIT